MSCRTCYAGRGHADWCPRRFGHGLVVALLVSLVLWGLVGLASWALWRMWPWAQ